jgi:branched-chain amino acid transport system ATP-binding protein
MLLEVKDLTAGYGRLIVLREVSFSIAKGETVAVIGANGAGKTTLLWSLCGLIRPKSGRVFLGKEEITGSPPPAVIKLGIGHVLEGMHVFGSLNVEDNLMLGVYGQRFKKMSLLKREKLDVVYRHFPVLEKKKHQLAGSLSGGEKQMLAIGRTLMCELKMFLLDEPSAGLAPLLVKQLFKILNELREALSLTILLVEQNAEMALGLSDRGLVLAQGRIVLQGDAGQLMNDPEVKRIYLGEGSIRAA